MGNDGVKNAGGEAAIGPDEIIAAVMKAKAGAVLPVIGETEMDRSRFAESLAASSTKTALIGKLSASASGRGDLSPWLCLAFDLPPFDPAPPEDRLKRHLTEATKDGKRAFLVIDEAQRLSGTDIRQLMRLVESIPLVLIGDETLPEKSGELEAHGRVLSPVVRMQEAETPQAAPKPAKKSGDAFRTISAIEPRERPAPKAPAPEAQSKPAPETTDVTEEPPAPGSRWKTLIWAFLGMVAALITIVLLLLFFFGREPEEITSDQVVFPPPTLPEGE